MKIAGSRIANNIDMEYQRKLDFFERHNCKLCKNKTTDLCEIRMTKDHQLKCVFYEKEDI